ncbi:MAG: fibrobacter succinogenes major paralogous domain-containing protein [Paludibacter sp.]|nr:fibrobacter succinogenes major paralogous domain-containing protein [Paludibacter sp.]
MNRTTKFRLPLFIIIGLLFVLTNSCVNTALLPVVETKSITAIGSGTATCWGNIPSDPGSAISARGVCWSTKPNPTTSNSKATTIAGTGNFSVAMSGLTMGTKYYIRCYATNKTGTAYGNQLTFTTLLVDYDGNTYNTVTIGTQVWMAENLKVTKFRNGNTITNNLDPTTWANLTSPSYCSYDNSAANKTTYGNLYNWSAVNDIRDIAPTGWHVPTQAEWTTLINYLGGASVAGDILKETGNTHWTGSYASATNTSGFTALPGGSIVLQNSNYGFYNIGTTGQWWSSSEADSNSAYSWSLSNNSAQAVNVNVAKQSGFSIRCVKD